MQAIEVKYLDPTDHRGTRLKATAQAGSLITDWDYNLSDEGNCRKAAMLLIDKLGWPSRISGDGVLKNGNHVFTI